MDVVTIFCEIDDFCQAFEPEFRRKLLADKGMHRRRAMKMRLSELMTIIVYFHGSGHRSFRHYYPEQVRKTMRGEFPGLVGLAIKVICQNV